MTALFLLIALRYIVVALSQGTLGWTTETCHLFCNITAKRVEKQSSAFYYPFKPVLQQTRLLKVAKSWCKKYNSSSTFCKKIRTCCVFYRPNANLFYSKWRSSRVGRDSRVILSNQNSIFVQTWLAATYICCKTRLNTGRKTRSRSAARSACDQFLNPWNTSAASLLLVKVAWNIFPNKLLRKMYFWSNNVQFQNPTIAMEFHALNRWTVVMRNARACVTTVRKSRDFS